VCDLDTSRMGAPYIYDISRLRVNKLLTNLYSTHVFYKYDRRPHKKLVGRMLVTGHGLNTNALVVTVTRLRTARLGYRTLAPGRGTKFSLLPESQNNVGCTFECLSSVYWANLCWC
jgi:hypothetical protein